MQVRRGVPQSPCVVGQVVGPLLRQDTRQRVDSVGDVDPAGRLRDPVDVVHDRYVGLKGRSP